MSQLQLLGVSCLHTAAKLEEIYPPKISDFALTTDGACNVEGIKKMEMVIAKVPSMHVTKLKNRGGAGNLRDVANVFLTTTDIINAYPQHLQWRFTPPVPHFWANIFASFLQHQNTPTEHLEEVSGDMEVMKNEDRFGDLRVSG